MKKKQRMPLGYRLLRFSCKVLGLVFLVLLVGTVAFQTLANQLGLQEAASISREELEAVLLTDAPAADESVVFSEHDTQIGGWGSGMVNILLIGKDAREGETVSRSDSMILCSLNKKTGQLTMTSLLRDLYVEIPGYRPNRINAAYAAGGMSLLKQTVEENFGVQVDGCVEVDFSGFAQLVDQLGGVTLELRQDEAELINSAGLGAVLEAGSQLLNGEQALTYSRIRNLDADGDFSRTARQRKVITALLQGCRQADAQALLDTFRAALPMITTDMKEAKLLLLALEVIPVLGDLEMTSQHIPADGTYEHRSIDGMAVLVADMDAARSLLEETLQ